MMRPIFPLIFAGVCLATPVLAMPLPDCAGGVEIARAKIVRVEKNGALILADGRAVLLEGIRLPLADHGSSALSDDALKALRALALAAPLTLTATPPKQDRYDRVRVQAFGDSWIQTDLLKRGLARVEIAPDRSECAGDLYAAERQARDSGTGLWAVAALGIRKAGSVSIADEGSFQVVEGRVANAALRDGQVFLDFSSDSRRGFSAIIAPDDRKTFRNAKPAPEYLAGHTVRLRGLVQNSGGKPQIAISNPAQIEFVN